MLSDTEEEVAMTKGEMKKELKHFDSARMAGQVLNVLARLSKIKCSLQSMQTGLHSTAATG